MKKAFLLNAVMIAIAATLLSNSTHEGDIPQVTIGKQVWMAKNLDVAKFRNGDAIPEAKTAEEWMAAGENKQPAWCYFNNDPANGEKYGKLYNWFAVNDRRQIAPEGWIVASPNDWYNLETALGLYINDYTGVGEGGNKMKSTSGWETCEESNGTNESGFSALPAGSRSDSGNFIDFGQVCTWWTTGENDSFAAFNRRVVCSDELQAGSRGKWNGFSVRCLRQ